MDSQLDENIDQLRQMTTAHLRLEYQELFGPPLRVASAPTADPRLPAPGTLLVKRYKNDRSLAKGKRSHRRPTDERCGGSKKPLSRRHTGTKRRSN